jgi:DNA-binding winged helix-turn-helix (wHTH) protein/tetratricopeptide (TPR) repeat protein
LFDLQSIPWRNNSTHERFSGAEFKVRLDRSIELANVAPFRIGSLAVVPALRHVKGLNSRAETVEPRVMLVLVALAQADGATVSRDDLVEQCWNGRIVGDDSINRVISKLRRVSERHANCFEIQTISKVGYRLEPDPSPNAVATVQEPALARFGAKSIRTITQLSQRRMLIGFGLALVLIGAAYSMWQYHSVVPGRHRPVINVDPFTVAGSGIPPDLAMQVRAETADLLANERYYAVSLAPQNVARRPEWHISGTVASMNNGRKVVVFAQLLRSGSDVAVAEMRIERDAQQPLLARSFGLRIGRTSGCVMLTVTNPDLTGGFEEGGLPSLVDACMTWHDKSSSLTARIEKFQASSLAFPHSAYFPARLAEMFGDKAADDQSNATGLRAQGAKYVSMAQAIDPTQPHILLAKARLLQPLDFSSREGLFHEALRARPTDCACEFGDYSAFLSMVGRNIEARDFAERAREKEPKNIPWLRRAGEAAAAAGDFDAARTELADVAGYLPDPSTLDSRRMNLAIWSRNWEQAYQMNDREPDLELRILQITLIQSLALADPARIRAAGMPFVARARSDLTNDRATVSALALSKHDSEAVKAALRLIERHPANLPVLFEPSFESARRTTDFAEAAHKLGLVDYWRHAGRLPDFCLTSDAPSLCAQIL